MIASEFLSVCSFLYRLMLSMDANFRLKNRLRRNARVDPPLGGGFGYQVKDLPYRQHLRNYVSEDEVCRTLLLVFSG
jgi:hypothetical protein